MCRSGDTQVLLQEEGEPIRQQLLINTVYMVEGLMEASAGGTHPDAHVYS